MVIVIDEDGFEEKGNVWSVMRGRRLLHGTLPCLKQQHQDWQSFFRRYVMAVKTTKVFPNKKFLVNN